MPTDRAVVTRLIGREPMGAFQVVVRRHDRSPVVIENAPLLDDGRPMPTRFWLVDRQLVKVIGRLESTGAVDRAETEIGPEPIARTHAAYAAARDALLPPGHDGPVPTGGVGGTRIGVKCLHAHYANLLAGADDVVGDWVERQLASTGDAFDPAQPGIVSEWSA